MPRPTKFTHITSKLLFSLQIKLVNKLKRKWTERSQEDKNKSKENFETPFVGSIIGLREALIMRERERWCYPTKQTQMGHPTCSPLYLPTPSSSSFKKTYHTTLPPRWTLMNGMKIKMIPNTSIQNPNF